MTQHRFTKGVADRGCGMFALLLSRLDDHERQHGHRPVRLMMHPGSWGLLKAESLRLFGVAEDLSFMNIPVTLCPCQNADFRADGPPKHGEYPIDLMLGADGKAEEL